MPTRSCCPSRPQPSAHSLPRGSWLSLSSSSMSQVHPLGPGGGHSPEALVGAPEPLPGGAHSEQPGLLAAKWRVPRLCQHGFPAPANNTAAPSRQPSTGQVPTPPASRTRVTPASTSPMPGHALSPPCLARNAVPRAGQVTCPGRQGSRGRHSFLALTTCRAFSFHTPLFLLHQVSEALQRP